MTVMYEWTVEEMDRDEDVIIDVDFFDTLKEALASAKDSSYDIALVRSEWQHGVMQERVYAYLGRGFMPTHFEDGTGRQYPNFKVPVRYLAEAARCGYA